jgi:hypothetical protein
MPVKKILTEKAKRHCPKRTRFAYCCEVDQIGGRANFCGFVTADGAAADNKK